MKNKNKHIMRLVFSMTLLVLAISSCVSAFKPPIEWSGTSYPLLVDHEVDRINLGPFRRARGNSWRVEGPKNSIFTVSGSNLVLSQIRRVSGVTTETSFAKFGAYTVTEFETASGTTVGTRSLHLVGKDSFRGVWIDTIRGNTEVALDLACLKLIDAALTRDPNWPWAPLNGASDYVPLKYAIGLVSISADTGSCPSTGSLWGAVWNKAYYPLYRHGGFHRHDLSVWGTHLKPTTWTHTYGSEPMKHVNGERASVRGVRRFISTQFSESDRESGVLTVNMFESLMYHTSAHRGYDTDIVAALMDTDSTGYISLGHEARGLLTALKKCDTFVELFNTADVNRDGVLTPSDLQGPASMGFLMSIVARVRWILRMDEQDYIMNREEYVRLRGRIGYSYPALWEEFKLVDADSDGVLTQKDLAVIGASAPMLLLVADVRAALDLPALQTPDTMLVWDEYIRLSIPKLPPTRNPSRGR
jgi:Ca2+-binding EF-hand superfamily protein